MACHMAIMAATLCNLSSGSGFMQLNHQLQNRQIITRCYSLAPLLVAAKRSSCCISSQRCSNKTCGRQIKVKRRHHWWSTSSNRRAEHSDTIYQEENIWTNLEMEGDQVTHVFCCFDSSNCVYLVLLASSVLLITWLNLSNDVYDFDTGADENKKESVVNLVGSRTRTLIAAYLLLVLGFMGLTWASVEAGSM